jgi:hypothetical protein
MKNASFAKLCDIGFCHTFYKCNVFPFKISSPNLKIYIACYFTVTLSAQWKFKGGAPLKLPKFRKMEVSNLGKINNKGSHIS